MGELPENKPGPTFQYSSAPTSNQSSDPSKSIAAAENVLQQRVAVVVIQYITGTAYLVPVVLHPTLNTEHYIMKIREEYLCALYRTKQSSWSSLFTKSIIGTARINQIIEQDLETPPHYPTVFITEYSYSDFLSHAWQRSRRLRHHESTLLPDYLISSSSSPQDCLGKPAIVVRQVLSKTKVAIMLLGLLILGSMLGVVVGICTGRADVAVAVAAGVFACVTVLQGLIAWLAA